MKKSYIMIIGLVNALMLLLFCILTVVTSRLTSSLETQQAAERWSADGTPYAQLSLFLEESNGVAIEEVYTYRVNIDKGLSDNSIKSDSLRLPDGTVVEQGRLWADAYSGGARMLASNGTAEVEASVTYTGGDYFFFHPRRLITGNFYADADLMKDRVVLDHNLAWLLYGAMDVAGMQIKVNGHIFYIAGVVAPETDKASLEVYGAQPRLYMHYDAAVRINPELRIISYEACIPNPISGLGLKIFSETVSADENRSVIIENSERYSFKKLFETAVNYSKAATRTNLVIYPYSENAALIVGAKAALLTFLSLITLLPPLITVVCMIWALIKNRKKLIGKLIKGLKNLFSAVKDRIKRGKNASPNE
ncbi:MAG: ABC transporter permease [Oscillospiraceae bacterium]|nr:ABC transporter permease [Oscillospiraceae bacterium]